MRTKALQAPQASRAPSRKAHKPRAAAKPDRAAALALANVATAAPVAAPSIRGVPQQHVIDATVFAPQDAKAQRRLAFLLQRGGLVLSASPRAVRVMHAGRVVRLDARGAVRWVD